MKIIDKFISYFAPRVALDRVRARAALNYANGYITPGSSRRSMTSWSPTANSPDTDILGAAPGSRAAVRDLFANSGLASGILRNMRNNVVGPGLILQSRIDRDALGMSDAEADAWEKNTEREFALWAESKECDAARKMNFKELQGLAFLSMVMNGDSFALLPYLKIKNSRIPYKLRVKLIEADLIRNPANVPDLGSVRGGIEYDDFGAPVSYYLMRPDQATGTYSWGKWTKIPAFGARTGRPNVLHLMDTERIGQRRGMSPLANVVELLKQVSRLTEAELAASVISSFFTVFVKNPTSDVGLMDSITESESVLDKSGDPDSMGYDATKKDDNKLELGPAMINELADGQDIEIAKPERPNDKFEGFFYAIVKQIGSSIGVPPEQILMVFNSSYSASRAALLEAWKVVQTRRAMFSADFCQPIYEEFLTEAITLGRISAPGFFNDPLVRKSWSRAFWVGRGQGQINPVVETNGAALRVEKFFSNYEDEAAMMSTGDWSESMVRRARQERFLTDNNLKSEESGENDG